MGYMVFMDESGDHNLVGGGDPNYPVFVLVAVLVSESEHQNIARRFEEIKKSHFKDERVIFHEREIRKAKGVFSALQNPLKRTEFLRDLDQVVQTSNFKIIASLIDKRQLVESYFYPENPYHLSLQFILERVCCELLTQKEVCIVAESRGKREDQQLQDEFNKILSGEALLSLNDPSHCSGKLVSHCSGKLKLHFHKKKDNIAGLQLADLIARPIGINYLRPGQPNRAYDTIRRKFRTGPYGRVEGYGLKIFPQLK